jgi:hypothetical protein
MKSVIIVLSMLYVVNLNAQANLKPRILTPISGHYKDLAKLSPKAIPDTTDRMQFPLEILSPKNALKLKLAPQYF